MIAGLTLGTELRRFLRSKLGRIAMVVLMLMPLMYSALYLWAFWNPFGHVDKMPVAFVNSDLGTEVDGEEINAGDQIVDQLKNEDRVHFDFVSEQEAEDGVRDGTYYFSVQLTPDFSEAVASPTTGDARKAVIQTTYNDSNGYLSTLIGENVIRTMLPVISDRIGEEAVDKVLIGIQSAGAGLEKAADGASRLHEGALKLSDGAVQLNEGAVKLDGGLDSALAATNKLNTGAAKVDANVVKLGEGADRLAAGSQQLNDQVEGAAAKLSSLTGGVNQLGGGVDQLADGAVRIDNGVQQLNATLSQVTDLQTTTSANIRQLADQLRPIPNPDVQNVVRQLDQVAFDVDHNALGQNAPATAQLNELAAGTSQLAYQLSDAQAPFRSGFDRLAEGTAALPGKLGELQNGVAQLNDGMQRLDSGLNLLHEEGTTRLVTGTGELRNGLQKLDDGAGRLVDGTTKLVDGGNRLSDGSGELATKLTEGSEAVPKWNTEQRKGVASVLGGPVRLTTTNDAGTHTFGAGLAPFFFSLAMFIGGLIIFMILRPLQNRAVASGVAPLRAALDGFLPAALIATGQATAIFLVTRYGVGLEPVYPIGLLAFCVLVSLMFTAMNQLLNAALGPGPGKVAAMAMLMLQLLASGGLYPVETEPALFQWLHPINPMTYSVNGFRQLMYGHVDHRLPQAVVAVALVFLLSMVLTALVARRDRSWTMKRLHPPIKI
ncbi:YhgE/Pip domain-containing protein [Corynebacterium pygosceleis]|uniref:YhgE/Pip domain-containing protein n=1 Tax=Corynebacterium pygosceleis TaxID=2800406 RepID=A0A9Q4GL84_9CORY|nr:YhgE/Pip domain-containing protein [Corynebacterium pygosceleis]MCK7638290.1 YhgE/Pip domain-containing protein [Corynebacterium pygosceleis]MCK7675270.1 YhgE/Pip domain-containing protein [Corynebacterium pygosceleis]MCX7468952.1 YhgE/Pip domain-containing protein [Corynebacterium pygosceleis]